MIERDDVLYLVDRISGMWPVIKNNDAQKEAIVLLIWEKRHGLTEHDLNDGYRMLIANSRTSRSDGAPAWPPSPSEILGCCLSAAAKRKGDAPVREWESNTPRRVAGMVCKRVGCNGPIDFIPSESVLWCSKCNSVQRRGLDHILTPHEVHDIHFVDEVVVTTEEVRIHKQKALEAFSKMTKERKAIDI